MCGALNLDLCFWEGLTITAAEDLCVSHDIGIIYVGSQVPEQVLLASDLQVASLNPKPYSLKR